MIEARRGLGLAALILIGAALASLLLRPLFPIDETRIMSVAWEMWLRGDFVLPTLNGEPYHHKPPLLSWLIQGSWTVFGVNEISARLISTLAALLSLPLVARLARLLWPQTPEIADYAPIVLASTLAWLVFSVALMFDILLGFFVLATLVATLQAAVSRRRAWFLLAGITLGLGLLAKGPVVLLDTLPVLLCLPWWRPAAAQIGNASWYGGLLLAVGIAAAIALLWVVPVGMRGGSDYEFALLWKQTAGRVSNSFAHARPWHWYLTLLPALALPWSLSLWEKAWRGWPAQESGERFCLAWFGLSLVAFSLISGKQAHYLLPALPALALWLGRRLQARPLSPWTPRAWGTLALVLGGLLAYAPEWCRLSMAAAACSGTPRAGALPLFGVGVALLMFAKARDSVRLLLFGAFSLSLLVGSLYNFSVIIERQDVQPIAGLVASLQAAGHPVAHVGKYQGQLQFSGRLLQPLSVIQPDEVNTWSRDHPAGYLLIYRRHPEPRLLERALADFPYRGRQVLIFSAPAWLALHLPADSEKVGSAPPSKELMSLPG